MLRQQVKVLVDVDDEKELREYPVAELKFKPRRKKDKKGAQASISKEEKELKELELLEKKEGKSKLDDD